jgi:hypothetical protein
MESTSIYPHAHAESGGLLGSADISAVCRHFGSLPTFRQFADISAAKSRKMWL